MKRILTAAALIPIAAYAVFWAGPRMFLAVLAAVACLSYWEYDGIAAGFGFGAPGPLGYALGLWLLLWRGDGGLPLTVAAMVALAWGMRAKLSESLPRAGFLITGVVYIFGCWRCAIFLREHSHHWLMYGLMLNWVGDAGAYYVGRRFGRHKLAPRVSPNKSWEGAAASVVTSVLLAGGYLLWAVPGVPVWHVVLLTAAANAAGQLGDLAESALKRGAGVKDSGAILPGHGGFLDRVDSTLFALPVVYAYLTLGAL
jgi:phosphatidate cytidylyltransferase